MEGSISCAGRAPVDEQEQTRPVNTQGDRRVAQTCAQRAPEAERTAGICGSRAGVLESRRTSHLLVSSSNARRTCPGICTVRAAPSEGVSCGIGTRSACQEPTRPSVRCLRERSGTLTFLLQSQSNDAAAAVRASGGWRCDADGGCKQPQHVHNDLRWRRLAVSAAPIACDLRSGNSAAWEALMAPGRKLTI